MNQITPTYRWAGAGRGPRSRPLPQRPRPATPSSLVGGYGFPDEFPDIAAEAMVAAGGSRVPEGLQYGPLYGLDDLRDEDIVQHFAQGMASSPRATTF